MAVLARAALPWRALVAGAMVSVMLGLALSSRLGLDERPATLSAVPAAVTHHETLSSLPFSARAQISAAVGAQAATYRLTPLPAGFRAVSQRQHLTVQFTRSGVRLQSGTTALGLSLRSVGYGGALSPVSEVAPSASANRLTYAHAGLSEWYVNGPFGVEQGFTIARAPSRSMTGPLTVSMALFGNARAALGRAAQNLVLTHPHGPTLSYAGLIATDARGRVLRSWLELRAGEVRVRVDARGAIYPLTIDPFVQQGSKLTAGGETGAGAFGAQVALSADGNTALIGGSGDNGEVGAAWVFTRSGSTWTQQAKLTSGEAIVGSLFGTSVALSADGNTALIGGFGDSGHVGAAWGFTRSGSTWTQLGTKLTAKSGEEIGGGGFGISVALSADGNTALIGASRDNGQAGAAWVFTRALTWTQQGPKLTAKSGEEIGEGGFGQSVALSADGNTALVGAYTDNSFFGAAWVFTRSGSTWSQQGSKLTGGGETLHGAFGVSVALSADGNTALIGGWEDNSFVGAVWIFTRSGSTWAQEGSKVTGGEEVGPSLFGTSVSLSSDGNTALVGGYNDNSALGAAWVLTRSGSTWTQLGAKLTGAGEVGKAQFGEHVALSADGNTALIGGASDNGGIGAAWVLTNPPSVTTGAASSVGATTAALNGTVGPGRPSTAHFQYGPTTAYGSSTAAQTVPGAASATPVAASISGLAPGTTYHFRIVAENSGGTSVGADQTFATFPYSSCLCLSISVKRPTVTSVSQSRRTWREGSRLARFARRRPPVGTTFSFTLNEPAKVSFAFTQPARGRKVAGRCLVQTNKNRRKHACNRSVTKGALAFTGRSGRNKVSFQGVISRSKKLRPGSYTLVITASVAGLSSAPQRLSFTIVK